MRLRLTTVVAVLASCCASVCAQLEQPWRLESYLYYSKGDYGDATETEILYIPLTVDYRWDRASVKLTTAFLSINAPKGTTVINGRAENVTGSTERAEDSGLADMLLKGSYTVKVQEDNWPWIDLFAKLKLPTADEEKGLGTGEADLELGAESVYVMENGWMAFLDVGYTFIGSPSGVDYSNRFALSPGAGKALNEDWMLMGFLEYSTAIGTGKDPLLLSMMAQRSLRPDLSAYAMLDLGLSDGAADYGLLAGVSWRF